ncbi:MAG: excinuclease ABC subunit UvrC, partial [Oscillospiraceae bacterium]|nr:excinuclease ABC subunit UvrC [Oscillospiraceae bacterium]
ITKQAGYSVKIKVPKRGEGKRLVDMVFSNASEQLASKLKYRGKEIIALQQLAELLDLEKPPSYIEAYDISNLGDTGIVGGMVVFENGIPSKKNYRKFSIKSVQIIDDYASMREMILRRIREYEKEKATNSGFGRLPDLILIDGGSGHIAAVKSIFDEEDFHVPYFGMVKDNKHRTRAITGEGGEISISSLKNAFLLLTKIQDEVHRYTISYQRNVRKRTAFEIELTHINGIGEKKALKLIRHFKSKSALSRADIQEISKVANVSEEKAKEISNFVNSL